MGGGTDNESSCRSSPLTRLSARLGDGGRRGGTCPPGPGVAVRSAKSASTGERCDMRVRSLSVLAVAVTIIALGSGPATALTPDTRVSVGSPATPFSQNKQNEPAVAVDADHPNVLVA